MPLADRRLDLLQADLVVKTVLGVAVQTEALGNEVVARSDEAHATRCLALGDLQSAKLKADAERQMRTTLWAMCVSGRASPRSWDASLAKA